VIIPFTQFSGMVVGVDPATLPPNAAQECVDVDFLKNTLYGMRGHAAVPEVTLPWNIKGGFIYSDSTGLDRIFAYPYDVDAVRSPLAQDDHNRFYWTGNNAGTTEFKFGLIGENTGDYVTSSYKVGVIDSTRWDHLPASLALRCDLVPSDAPVALSAIQNSSGAFWITDASGTKIRDISADMVSFSGVGTPTANGWYRSYSVTMAHPLTYYTTAVVSSVTYTKVSAEALIDGGSSPVVVDLWQDASGVTKYIVVRWPEQLESLASVVGTQVSVSHILAYDHNNIPTDSNGLAVYNTESIGSFYVKSSSGLSFDNSAIPSEMLDKSATSVLPKALSVGFVWKFDYNDQHFETMFNTDASLSGTVDVESGISGTISAASGTTWDLNLTFGSGSASETRAYGFTIINQLGEESEMSIPYELTLQPGKEHVRFIVNVASFVSTMNALALGAGRYPLHGIRVYRSVGGQFFYVGTINASGLTAIPGEHYLTGTGPDVACLYFEDTVVDAALGDACTTVDYISNTEELQGLQGLTTVYNGMLAAFKANEVWLCEPYMPWAWKRANVVTLPYKVIDIHPYEQGIVVFTERKNYYMSGQLPNEFVPSELIGEFPAVNKNSALGVDGQLVYMSTDGLAVVQGGRVTLDQSCMTRDVWRELLLNLGSNQVVRLAHFGHRILIYLSGVVSTGHLMDVGGILVDMAKGTWTYTTITPKFAMHAPVNSFSAVHDNLVFSTGNQWQIAYAGSTLLVWSWWSRDTVVPHPTNFGVLQVFGTGQIKIVVRADDATVFDTTVSLGHGDRYGRLIRLPAGFRGVRWSVAFGGLGTYEGLQPEISKAFLATTIEELKGV